MNIKAIKYGRIKRQAVDRELIELNTESLKIKFIETINQQSEPTIEEPHKPKNYDLAMRVLEARRGR